MRDPYLDKPQLSRFWGKIKSVLFTPLSERVTDHKGCNGQEPLYLGTACIFSCLTPNTNNTNNVYYLNTNGNVNNNNYNNSNGSRPALVVRLD